MKGTRPLTTEEILLVARQFSGTFSVRNRSLFMLGVSVGGRISELLALTIGDVWQNRKPVSDLLFVKGVVKAKQASRLVPVNADGRAAIADLIAWHQRQYDELPSERPLFPSRKGAGDVSMTRKTAHEVLKEGFVQAGLNGKLATHSLRKSFAQRVFDSTGNIYLVQELLGHTTIDTTKKYLGISYQLMQNAVESIEISERNRTKILLHSPASERRNTSDLQRLQSELERKDAIIDRLLTLTPHSDMPNEKQVIGSDDKMIPIELARRKRG